MARDQQHLGAEEELEHDQSGEQGPDPVGRAPLADQQLVEGQHDQRRDGQEGDVELVEGELGEHEGGEAVGDPPEECGGTPGDPAPQQHEHGEGREGRRQGEGHVHRRDRPGHQGHRGQEDPECQHAGVGEQVDPGRMEQPLRIEHAVPVAERVCGPGEEPEEPGGVAAPAGGGRRGVGAPHAPPQLRSRAAGRAPRPPRCSGCRSAGATPVAPDRRPPVVRRSPGPVRGTAGRSDRRAGWRPRPGRRCTRRW